MTLDPAELRTKHCAPCEGTTAPLAFDDAQATAARLPGWALDDSGKTIARAFKCRDFAEAMALAGAVAWIAHREDHHPDLEVSYGSLVVRYTTHAIDGLSENDFISAAKVDALLDE